MSQRRRRVNRPQDLWTNADIGRDIECWPWKRWRDRDGYGEFSVDGRKFKAHRLAYEIATGTDPTGLVVCHRCDNPSCINPAHLFLGTQGDNRRDSVSKLRHLFGSRHPAARVSEADVIAIRSRRNAGEQGRALAAEYGLSEASISNINSRRTWRHVA